MILRKVELISKAASGFSAAVDVTNFVIENSISDISIASDSTDFSFGVYTFSNGSITFENSTGEFDLGSSNTLFQDRVNNSKIRVTFVEASDDVSEANTETIFFTGLIADEGTKKDVLRGTVTFKILSLDSIMNRVGYSGGSVSNGQLFSTAIFNILNQLEITEFLTLDASNINCKLDLTIDDASAFEGASVSDALNDLLLASNSALYVNSNFEIIVKSRASESVGVDLNLYGPHDLKNRTNILDLTEYNDGFQRVFTNVKVNNSTYTDVGYASDFGFKSRNIALDFITDNQKQITIATSLVNEFRAPKVEFMVKVPFKTAKNLEIFDLVSVDYPYKLTVEENKFLPILGDATLGDSETPLPKISGFKIESATSFKIIEINHDVKSFTTELKLRQSGTATGDGVLTALPILGFAILGESKLTESV